MKKPIPVWQEPPKHIGAGALYPYSEELHQFCAREDAFDEPYNMAEVKPGGNIVIPRRMACLGEGVADLRTKGNPVKFYSSFEPRNYEQARVIQEASDLLLAGESFVINAPTGFGKTYCAMDIIARVGVKTLVVVTKEDIRDQWEEAALKMLGISAGPKGKVGFIQGDTFQVTGRSLVIAMVQSLAKEARYNEVFFREFGFVIWDEVHRMGADYFSKSAYRCPAKLRLGISATTDRRDGRSLVFRAHIGEVLVSTEALPMVPRIKVRRSPWKCPRVPVDKEFTDPLTKQVCVRRVIQTIPHSPGMCGHIINMLAGHHGRNKMLAKFIAAAYNKGRHTLVLSDRKEHLEVLQSLVGGFKVPYADTSMYVGGLTKEQREAYKKYRVIFATYQFTAEATDIPTIDALVMATPKSDVIQVAGRACREVIVDGVNVKKTPVIFDVVDATSPVLYGYYKNRMSYYKKIKAEVDLPDGLEIVEAVTD